MGRDRLRKPSVRRLCKNCDAPYTADSGVCQYCAKNPRMTNNWQPNTKVCKEIVMHYLKQRPLISSAQIARHAEISQGIVDRAIRELVKEGTLKMETSVVVVR